MKKRVLILGAGFGGLELSTLLSETLGTEVDTTVIEKNDSFVFGYSKLDVMFGRQSADAVRLPYKNFAKPGVRFVQQAITAIDPGMKRVTTDGGEYEADFMVIALGADYDVGATPGLETANEFYSVAGATRLRDVIPTFTSGRVVIGICGAPYKCPPAPSECALLLHDDFLRRGVRDKCEITLVTPLERPVPPSPDTSRALIAAFAERNITFVPNRKVTSLDPARRVAVLDDGTEYPYDLFLGVPKHCAPKVLKESGLTEQGWVPVNQRTLATTHPGVYAIGDIANTGGPKAGVFAESAARSVASSLIAAIRRSGDVQPYAGAGTCYLEFGGGLIGRVDMEFFAGPKPASTFHEPTVAGRAHKEEFGATRRQRWFGGSASP
jgi:sulfide:quinone oxidoreductase